ncbi:MAG: hypothetical protein Q9170_004532 [Blastenia crenularia]
MVVCKFFLEGRCKFGDSCKNEHPRNTTTNRNPFAPLQNNNRSNQPGSNTLNRGPKSADYPYHLDKDIISKDLTNERPLYILSAYGPGRDAPQQLFGGQPREQSFEELRQRHYELSSTGNQDQAIQEAKLLYSNADQQIQTVLSDLDGALKYITDAANQHPNRLDVCKAKGGDASQQQQPSGSFGSAAPSASGPRFGQPSFGQPSAPAFGKPSFGQAPAPAPAFGQPANLGQKPAVFGQASNPNPAQAFGQPVNLNQAPAAFGQISDPSTAPTFGQNSTPSQFGQPQRAAKPFGVQQPQQPPVIGQITTPLPFGQPQQLAKPFGSQEAPNQLGLSQQTNAFGKQPSTGSQASGIFGQQPAPASTNPFAKAPPTSSGFGQPSTALAPTNPFGKPEAPQTSNAFSKAPSPQPAANPFASKELGQNAGTFGQSKQPSAPAFGQPSAPLSTGFFGKPTGKPPAQLPATVPTAPATQANRAVPITARFETDREGKRRLTSWQGQRVTYVGEDPCIKHFGDGGWQKIWFPEGPPTLTSRTQQYPDGFTVDEAARENFQHFFQHGSGLDGLIPEMPPPRDMISWNF